jgi:uncharacterized membrane protein YedE/YeeE
MMEFTPVSSFAGGVLIGAAASLLLVASGRIAGISGIVGGLLDRPKGDVAWRVAFVAGLVTGGGVLRGLMPGAIGAPAVASPLVLVSAGLLVGFGTRLGNGCTSGHGVCGVSRLSRRSLVATGVFMAAGMAATFVVRHLLGGLG